MVGGNMMEGVFEALIILAVIILGIGYGIGYFIFEFGDAELPDLEECAKQHNVYECKYVAVPAND